MLIIIIIEILLTLFLMNLNYTTWLVGNYYKLLILIVETVEPHNMNQPVEGSQYCIKEIKEGWPMTARWAPFRQRILKMRNVRVPESGNETVLTTHQINKVPAPQVQPLVDFWGNLGNRKPRSLWWFGDMWGIFWPVSISFRFPRVAICCHKLPPRTLDTTREWVLSSAKPAVSGRCVALTAKAPEGLLRWRVLWLGGRKQILGTRKFLGDTLEMPWRYLYHVLYHQIPQLYTIMPP